MEKTLQLKIIELLSDWKYHKNTELSRVAWWRFWWHIHQLKKKWFTFIKKWKDNNDRKYVEYWKLDYCPQYEIVNWHIKTIHTEIKKIIEKTEKEKTFIQKCLDFIWINIK